MKQLKQMGYSTLELAGYNNGKINGVDMMEFKKMAEDAGLKITSSHVNPPTGEYTPDTRNTIMEYWKNGRRSCQVRCEISGSARTTTHP